MPGTGINSTYFYTFIFNFLLSNMIKFKILELNKAKTLVSQVLEFTKKFPLEDSFKNKEEVILSNIYDFYNVIHYQNTKNSKFNVIVEFEINGKLEKVDIIENSTFILGSLFKELLRVLSIIGLTELIELSNHLLNINGIKLYQKTAIIDLENTILRKSIYKFIEIGDEWIVIDFLNNRTDITLDAIYNYDELIKDNNHFNQKIEALYNIFNLYFEYIVNLHIYKNQIFQAYKFLFEHFEENDDLQIKKILLSKYIILNSKFLLEPISQSIELLEDNKSLFKEEELDLLKNILNPDLKSIDIPNLEVIQGHISKKLTEDKKITTVIRFCIPFELYNGEERIDLNERSYIHFKKADNFLSDPIFRMYKDLSILGIGWNFFSDAFSFENKDFLIATYVCYDFIHPDLKLNEETYELIDFSEKEALMGRKYYPHKEYLIKEFLKYYQTLSRKVKFDKIDISINLFSNYIVEYYIDKVQAVNYYKSITDSGDSRVLLFKKLYTLTNPSSFSGVSKRFIERLTELNLSDSFIHIRELIDKTQINSDKTLSIFMHKLLEIVVKNNIELQENYQYFWKKSDKTNKIEPLKEPQVQPFILSNLKAICNYTGIQITREGKSANGAIDFHCAYTNNGNLYKICIELKNAHSQNIEDGIIKQLPQYLKSERTKFGIYLVLWYKGEAYDKPKEYKDIEELETKLHSIKNKDYRISILTIDCNKPIVPSKL